VESDRVTVLQNLQNQASDYLHNLNQQLHACQCSRCRYWHLRCVPTRRSTLVSSQVPQQPNADDCGVYLIKFVGACHLSQAG
jgi:hypothetical protein